MKINTWDSSYNQFLVDVSLEYENDLWLETHDKKAPLYKKARCYGQVYIDCLESTRPKIAGKLKNTLLDPSVRNNCPPDVHKFVESMWGKSTFGGSNSTDAAS